MTRMKAMVCRYCRPKASSTYSLGAVRYDGVADNALQTLFEQWSDPEWLVDFFMANMADLESYFKITDINQAIYDTIDDNQHMQCLILDLSPEADLDKIFRPLENSRTSEMLLGKEKAKIKERPQHASWLRIYAIKLEPGCYVQTLSYGLQMHQSLTFLVRCKSGLLPKVGI